MVFINWEWLNCATTLDVTQFQSEKVKKKIPCINCGWKGNDYDYMTGIATTVITPYRSQEFDFNWIYVCVNLIRGMTYNKSVDGMSRSWQWKQTSWRLHNRFFFHNIGHLRKWFAFIQHKLNSIGVNGQIHRDCMNKWMNEYSCNWINKKMWWTRMRWSKPKLNHMPFITSHAYQLYHTFHCCCYHWLLLLCSWFHFVYL